MDFDMNMMDVPSQTETAVATAPVEDENAVARKVCGNTLKSLGFEVKESDGDETFDFIVKRNDVQYRLIVTNTEPHSETHLKVPVGCINSDSQHVFNMKADCIAFYQSDYDGGTIFQFKLDTLKDFVKPIVDKMKAGFPAFHAHNAISMKRVHAVHRPEKDGYDMYVYLPIDFVTKNLKHSKQSVGKK